MRLLRSINGSVSLALPVLLAVCVCVNVLADSVETSANTNDNLPEPHRVVQDITSRLLFIINDGKSDPITSPDKFYNSAIEILEPIVAFDYIAKAVMGNYADQVTSEQQQRFIEIFKKNLVKSYSKAIADLSGSTSITILQPEVKITDQRKVTVIQKFLNQGTISYVSYTMAQNRAKQWKVVNVVLNGINLGKTFRGQFAQAVQNNQGNLIKVIDAWGKDS
jgi:phospholipid transport system substrate-binding protein